MMLCMCVCKEVEEEEKDKEGSNRLGSIIYKRNDRICHTLERGGCKKVCMQVGVSLSLHMTPV